MAKVQKAILTEYTNDGSVVMSNIRKGKTDLPIIGNNETYSATLVTEWYDGSPMDDSKADGAVYLKYKGTEYPNYTGSYFRVNLPNDGELFLEKDTVAQLRAMSAVEILLLKMGYYKGVKLNGYHEKGDIPKPEEFKIFTTVEDESSATVVEVSDIKLVSKFTVTKQSTLPLVETDWKVLYDVTCPERGDVDSDTSTDEFRDYVNIKGTLNVHELQQSATVRVNSDIPSFGQRALKGVKFNFIVVGWRQFYKIDDAFLHLSEPPQPWLNNNGRDLIRVVKVGRLHYQLQVRQDHANSVVIPKIEYERKSEGSVIEYLKDIPNTITNPNVVKNSYNYDTWVENIDWENILHKPEFKVSFPVKYDQKLNITLNEIPEVTPLITRVGVYREANYSTPDTFNWGTRSAGLPDSITAETIPNSSRQFLRFKLRPNQTATPERSELSTIQPVTPIEGDTSIRWFSGMLRLPETLKVQEGNAFVIMQFLPESTPVGREPCVALFVRNGHLFLDNRNNPRGTTGDLSGEGGINVRPTMRTRRWDLGAINLGSWDKIIIKIDFQWDDSGTLQLWRNDELLVDYQGANTWYDPGKNTPFIKFGIYNALWASTADENLDSTYDLQVDWCDPRLGGYQATYLSMTPDNITDYRGLRVNIDGDVVNSKVFQQNGVNIASFPSVPVIQTTDVSTIFNTGNYSISGSSTNIPVAATGNLMVFRTSGSTIVHIYIPNTGNQFYVNVRSSGVWTGWRNLLGIASTTVRGLVNQSAASADTAEQAAGATPTKAEFDALLSELRDLKTKLRTAGILAT